MDPYERAQLEYEGLRQAEPAISRLRDKALRLRKIATSQKFSRTEPVKDLATVNKTKSSPFATLKRRHPGMPLPAHISLAVIALCLGGIATWLVRKRSQ